jgi:hypothetical protein
MPPCGNRARPALERAGGQAGPAERQNDRRARAAREETAAQATAPRRWPPRAPRPSHRRPRWSRGRPETRWGRHRDARKGRERASRRGRSADRSEHRPAPSGALPASLRAGRWPLRPDASQIESRLASSAPRRPREPRRACSTRPGRSPRARRKRERGSAPAPRPRECMRPGPPRPAPLLRAPRAELVPRPDLGRSARR